MFFFILLTGENVKKILILSFFIFLFLFGCTKTANNPMEKFITKSNNYKDYSYDAIMEIKHDNTTSKHQISVIAKRPNKYLVTVQTLNNGNVQKILKNDDGVFIITPETKKQFKFQSDWPNNSKTPFIIDSVIKNIINDKDAQIINQENGYLISSKIEHKTNKNLKIMHTYVSDKFIVEKVVLMNEALSPFLTITFSNFKTNKNIDDSKFVLDEIIKNASLELGEDDYKYKYLYMYPRYMSEGLELKESVQMNDMLVMIYQGENDSVSIIETRMLDNMAVTSSTLYGDIEFTIFGVSVIESNSVSYAYDGIFYEVASKNGNLIEIMKIINSFYSSIEK